jgi:RNA polymerase sigma factor (sigma-70 family)
MGEGFEGLLLAARLGAEWAWRAIYFDLAPDVLRYARASRVSDPDDLVGDVFLRVVRGIEGFEGDERDLRAWVFTFARNLAIDNRRRKDRRRTEPVGEETLVELGSIGDAEDDAMRALAEERVRGMLDHLTSEQRDVLLLRILGDLSIEQVATVLGKHPGAIKALQSRALATIRRKISTGAVSL